MSLHARERSRFVPVLSVVGSCFLLSALLFVACGKKESGESEDRSRADIGIVKVDADGYADPPPVGSYPATQAEVQKWIDAYDMKSIRAHGWDVWASITAPTDDDNLPVWETWYSGSDIFGQVDTTAQLQHRLAARLKGSRVHEFERPKQFHHPTVLGASGSDKIPRNTAEQVTAFNRYTRNVAEFIWKQGYNRASVLDSINVAFDKAGTPVADRQVIVSADSVEPKSIVLKPVFQFISGTEPTAIPYWNGISPLTTTNLANPEPYTWRQAVVVDPTGKLKPGSTVEMSFNGEPKQKLTVVSLDDFFYIKLTREEAEAFSQFAETSGDDLGQGNQGDSADVAAMVKEGNIALLMAMHVTTKEIPNWTWQTFWWAADPGDPQFGGDRPSMIKGPWAHYNMNTAYFMVTPDGDPNGDPYVSFNPYLETNLKGDVSTSDGRKIHWTGTHSNCMTCHRLAAWQQNPGGSGPNTPHYQPDGFIDPADSALFGGFTKLDFLWSLTRAD